MFHSHLQESISIEVFDEGIPIYFNNFTLHEKSYCLLHWFFVLPLFPSPFLSFSCTNVPGTVLHIGVILVHTAYVSKAEAWMHSINKCERCCRRRIHPDALEAFFLELCIPPNIFSEADGVLGIPPWQMRKLRPKQLTWDQSRAHSGFEPRQSDFRALVLKLRFLCANWWGKPSDHEHLKGPYPIQKLPMCDYLLFKVIKSK